MGFIAACMALNALAIDVMLPALPMLNADFSLANPNLSQAVIATYLLGMGLSQLFYGPLSDRYSANVALDGADDPVYLAPNNVYLNMVKEKYPKLRFDEAREVA